MITSRQHAPAEFISALKDQLVHQLQTRPEIRFALLYGSASEGYPYRDLDVGIYVDRSLIPARQDIDYMFDLAEQLTHTLACPIDVRVINDAPLSFRYNVSRGQALMVNDAESLARFRETTWDAYFDFQPIALQYLKDMR